MPKICEPNRGSEKIIEKCFDGNVPVMAIKALKQEAEGIVHGRATLTIIVNDGHLTRYITSREKSFIPDKLMTGPQLL